MPIATNNSQVAGLSSAPKVVNATEPVCATWSTMPTSSNIPEPTWMIRYRMPARSARRVRDAQIRKTELMAVSSQYTNSVIRSPANTALMAAPA